MEPKLGSKNRRCHPLNMSCAEQQRAAVSFKKKQCCRYCKSDNAFRENRTCFNFEAQYGIAPNKNY